MHFSKSEREKLIEWVSFHIMEAKKYKIDDIESVITYADYLLFRVENLMKSIHRFRLPGGTTYSAYMKNAVEHAKQLIESGKVNCILGTQLLKNLSTKIDEAIELFKKGK
jgi:hypothetical protein